MVTTRTSSSPETCRLAAEPFTDDIAPVISHDVIASYIADAARSVPGIVGAPHLSLEGPCVPEARDRVGRRGGQRMPTPEGSTSTYTPEWLGGLLSPRWRPGRGGRASSDGAGSSTSTCNAVTLFVDEIAGPVEGGVTEEG